MYVYIAIWINCQKFYKKFLFPLENINKILYNIYVWLADLANCTKSAAKFG